MSDNKDSTAASDLSVSIYEHPTNQNELVAAFTPPAMPAGGSKNRFPVDVVCCVDVSGSMRADAPVQDTSGVKESTGLNVLQVVGHAVRTVAALLGEDDRLAIVTYSSTAAVGLDLVRMNEDGKKKVDDFTNAMQPRGTTNMWAGIQAAFGVLDSSRRGSASNNNNNKQQSLTVDGEEVNNNNNNRSNRLETILLLTDGRPTDHPPSGYQAALSGLLAKTFGSNQPFPLTMSTFGFGYSVDSKLLDDLATMANGMFGFIPDAGLIGTVFVNSTATLLSAAATSIAVAAANETTTSMERLPDVQFGAAQTLWFKKVGCASNNANDNNNNNNNDDSNSTTAQYNVRVSFASPSGGSQVLTVPVQPASAMSPIVVEKMRHRQSFVEAVRGVGKATLSDRESLKGAVTVVRDGLQRAVDGPCKNMVKAMVEDLDSQVLLALGSDEYFQRWGQHYALSLARANELCIQSNFKDKSVQNYGGKLFEELREVGEAQFLKIPAPKPEPRAAPAVGRQVRSVGSSAFNAPASAATGFTYSAPAPVSMSSYYDYSGGCVLSTCEVLMADGVSTKLARDVRRGDALFGGAVVQCAVRIDKRGATLPLVVFADENKNGGGGSPLVITKFHPVRRANNNSWSFPVDVAGGEVRDVSTGADGLFTFLLHDNNNKSNNNMNKSFVRVNGIDVIAWGHGISDDATARHDFFGSRSAVVAALRKIDQRGFDEDGAVTIGGFERDPQTRLIRGLAPV